MRRAQRMVTIGWITAAQRDMFSLVQAASTSSNQPMLGQLFWYCADVYQIVGIMSLDLRIVLEIFGERSE